MGPKSITQSLGLLISLLAVSSMAWAESSFEDYALGNFVRALGSVRKEIQGELLDSSAFMTRVRIATHSFAQDPSIPVSEILSVLDAALPAADRFGYGERIREESAAMTQWFSGESSARPALVLEALQKLIAQPRSSIEQIRKRSTQLLAIGCLARRKAISGSRDPEWLYVAAKALDADSGSGEAFFEAYLEHRKTTRLRFEKEAQKELKAAQAKRASQEPLDF